ncbi:MAG: DUF6918 family protein [Micromonosporaceae bacterium]
MTSTLQDILLAPERRPAVVEDCQQLIDSEVASKDGASGMVVKASYKIVKAVRPNMITHASDSLLTDFVPRLEPFYAEFRAQGSGSLSEFFAARSDAISEALLGVTDDRAARTGKATLKKAYEKLRPSAKEHVTAAMPGLSQLIEKHTGS